MLTETQAARAAALFAEARRSRTPMAPLPLEYAPRGLKDAYAIQDAFARRQGGRVAGYKVGCASPESQRLVGASGPFAALVFAANCVSSPAVIRASEFFSVGIEAEFAFRLARDLRPAGACGREEAAAAVGEVVCAIEICDTRLADWRAAGLHQMIADNGFHGGLVTGPGAPLLAAPDLSEHEVVLTVDGAECGRGTGRLVLGHPLDSLAWLAGELARYGKALRAGDIVAAGTCTGLHFVKPRASVMADFGALGRVEMKIED